MNYEKISISSSPVYVCLWRNGVPQDKIKEFATKHPVEQPSKTTTLSNDTVVTDTLQKAENVQDTAKVAQ